LAANSPLGAAVVAAFPTSLYIMRKYFGLGKDKFTKYVILYALSVAHYIYLKNVLIAVVL